MILSKYPRTKISIMYGKILRRIMNFNVELWLKYMVWL